MSQLAVGDVVPLFVQLGNGETNRHVRATVRDAEGNALASDLVLTHTAAGLYQYGSFLMPNYSSIVVQYSVYADADLTQLEAAGSETYTRDDLASATQIIVQGPVSAELEPEVLYQGEARGLVFKMVDYDLDGVTEITAKFKKSSGSILEKKFSTGGVSNISIGSQTFKVNLTKADTLSLAVNTEARVVLLLDKSAERRIVEKTIKIKKARFEE